MVSYLSIVCIKYMPIFPGITIYARTRGYSAMTKAASSWTVDLSPFPVYSARFISFLHFMAVVDSRSKVEWRHHADQIKQSNKQCQWTGDTG